MTLVGLYWLKEGENKFGSDPSNVVKISNMPKVAGSFYLEKGKVRAEILPVANFTLKGKPVTSDIRGSTTIPVVKKLQDAGYSNIHGYDPAVLGADIAQTGAKVVGDYTKGFVGADAVLVMTNHPDFEALAIRALMAKTNTPSLLYDCWSLYNADEIKKVRGVEYKRL